MIKLFRNIRKNLLNDGETTKYFKYAVGEIVLVVIGILIALQINNWNEDRKDKAIVQDVLKNIRYDLVADTVAYAGMLKQIPIAMDPSRELLNGTFQDTISANALFEKLPYYSFAHVVKNQSYEKVINAGITDFFEFNSLFDDINTYYTTDSNRYNQVIKWDDEDTSKDGVRWLDMNYEVDVYQDTFYTENEIKMEQSEEDRKIAFLEQLKQPAIRNSIKMNIYRKMRLKEDFQKMKQKATSIIQKIDEELKE
ncbi:DUF6090 family protein [Nonlabens marinus]|uniref:Uncharacterized protein n=1 Tax=Nonlabens marinus S1-08 TaxID=1454201 RepID=W8VT52_9FLAO|nr:DUF6090 family protein [Nonlabens marinus]BAO56770.1 hypothetical protein NMS_2761 [Nonlabens marinus S1-08]